MGTTIYDKNGIQIMGTTIYDKNGIQITRFYGGQDRGVCYQINIGTFFIQLTHKEYIKMLIDLLNDFFEWAT